MKIRIEKPEDIKAIDRVNFAAFGRKNEADLVNALRNIVEPSLSFVAIKEEQIVGHIFFSPVSIESDPASSLRILGLATLAVLPQFQKQGIGSLLVQYGMNYPNLADA